MPDWDGTIAKNLARTDGSSGFILRNSVNNQSTIGAISKLRKDYASGWTTEVGVDWRTAEVEHYREVRDLLGGSHYVDDGSEFWVGTENQRVLGDRIDYNNTNSIDWVGAYLQAERSTTAGSFYGMMGWAQNSYTFTDHFKRAAPGSSQKLVIESGNLHGYQIKGGASRNVTDEVTLFGNAGFVSKVPIFDGVIDDYRGVKNPDPKNEKFVSFEAGASYRARDRGVSLDATLYHTTWRDRTRNLYVPQVEGLVSLLGVDARHMGIELSGAYQPSDFVRFDAAASLGNWQYIDDATGRYTNTDEGVSEDYAFYLKDLKVADAPQRQLSYAMSLYPVSGLWVQFLGRSYGEYYADFDPFDRIELELDANGDRVQPWKTPGYTVFDLNSSYRLNDLLPVWKGGDVRLFANVFNVFDKAYVQDATDNSSYNGFDDDHDADDAEVFLGLPRYFNVGFQIIF